MAVPQDPKKIKNKNPTIKLNISKNISKKKKT
jgi:hypothetical protein